MHLSLYSFTFLSFIFSFFLIFYLFIFLKFFFLIFFLNLLIYFWLCWIFSSVQLLSHVQFSATPWIAARQASLSITNSQSLPKLTPIESVMPSNHLILCRPLLLQPSIFPSIIVFSNESVLRIMRPKYWNFSFSISPSNEYSGLISWIRHFLMIKLKFMKKNSKIQHNQP